MWADMALTGGKTLLQMGFDYNSASKEAESKKAWLAYKNAMTQLANANNQNTITTNEILLNKRVANQRFQIGRSSYITSGAATAAAAASDTGGRSVNMTVFDVERNASMQQANVQADLEAQYLNFDAQRTNSAMQAAQQHDYTTVPTPNLAAYALDFGATMTNKYNSLNGTKL